MVLRNIFQDDVYQHFFKGANIARLCWPNLQTVFLNCKSNFFCIFIDMGRSYKELDYVHRQIYTKKFTSLFVSCFKNHTHFLGKIVMDLER